MRPWVLYVTLIRCIYPHQIPRRYLAHCIHLHGKTLDTIREDPKVTQLFHATYTCRALANQTNIVFGVVPFSK
jgi:hypothetical protein